MWCREGEDAVQEVVLAEGEVETEMRAVSSVCDITTDRDLLLAVVSG